MRISVLGIHGLIFHLLDLKSSQVVNTSSIMRSGLKFFLMFLNIFGRFVANSASRWSLLPGRFIFKVLDRTSDYIRDILTHIPGGGNSKRKNDPDLVENSMKCI